MKYNRETLSIISDNLAKIKKVQNFKMSNYKVAREIDFTLNSQTFKFD